MNNMQQINNDALQSAVLFANRCIGATFTQYQLDLATDLLQGKTVPADRRWCDQVQAYYHGAMYGGAAAKQQQSGQVTSSTAPTDAKAGALPTADDFLTVWAPRFGMTVRDRADVAAQLVHGEVAPMLAAKDVQIAELLAKLAVVDPTPTEDDEVRFVNASLLKESEYIGHYTTMSRKGLVAECVNLTHSVNVIAEQRNRMVDASKVVDALVAVRHRVINELDNKPDEVGHYRVRECDVVKVIDEAIKTANGSTVGQQVATSDDACADTPKRAEHNWRRGGTDNNGDKYFVGDANDLRLRATYNPKLGKWSASAARNGVDVVGTSGAASAEEAMSSMNALLRHEPRWWLSGEESKKVTRVAYEQLVNEDLAWLLKQPRTLERDHVEAIVRASVDVEYPPKTTTAPPCGPCQGSGKLWDSNRFQFGKCDFCDGSGTGICISQMIRQHTTENRAKLHEQLVAFAAKPSLSYNITEKDPAKRAEMVAACLNERGVLRGHGHPEARAEFVNDQHMVRFTARISHVVDLLEQEKMTILQLAMEIETSDEAHRRGRKMMQQTKKV